MTGPVALRADQVKVYGFRLTEDHRLTKETIAAIDEEDTILWKIGQ